MATGLPDYVQWSFLQEKAAILYFETVFLKMLDAITMSDQRFVPTGSTLVLMNSMRVREPGLLLIMGTMTVTEVPSGG